MTFGWGLGFELALGLPALLWFRRMRRRSQEPGAPPSRLSVRG